MMVGRIPGATRNLGAPPGWVDDVSGPCAHLPVLDGESGGYLTMTSAWIPTPEEIERISAGAPVYLTIVGAGHPVVALGVGHPPD